MPNQATATATTPTNAELQAKIAQLEAQLAAKNNRSLTMYIGEDNGTVCVGGLDAQFPLAKYAQQWEKLVEFITGKPLTSDMPLGAFISKHSALIPLTKDESKNAEVSKNKLTLRRADTSGAVKHVTEEQRKKNAASNSK